MLQKRFCISERRQTNEQINVVRLNLCFVCRLISADLTAFITAMNDDVALFGIGFYLDRAQNAAARIHTVAGIDIHVQGAKTARAVIAGAVAQRFDGQTAVFTYESIVVFGESFLFHNIVLRYFHDMYLS